MANPVFHKYLNGVIALVWLLNGLVCKVLNIVPRHQQIVGEILGNDHARPMTMLIGILEIMMAFWVFSRFKAKLNATIQITVVAVMNALEIVLTPHLLLWGRLNGLFALLFIGIIIFNQFVLQNMAANMRHV